MSATRVASRPNTCPSASTCTQRRSTSPARTTCVFIEIPPEPRQRAQQTGSLPARGRASQGEEPAAGRPAAIRPPTPPRGGFAHTGSAPPAAAPPPPHRHPGIAKTAAAGRPPQEATGRRVLEACGWRPPRCAAAAASLQQHHLACLDHVARLQAVEVDAAAHEVALVITSVPHRVVR